MTTRRIYVYTLAIELSGERTDDDAPERIARELMAAIPAQLDGATLLAAEATYRRRIVAQQRPRGVGRGSL